MKNLSKLGKALNKNEQKLINGGGFGVSPGCTGPGSLLPCDLSFGTCICADPSEYCDAPGGQFGVCRCGGL